MRFFLQIVCIKHGRRVKLRMKADLRFDTEINRKAMDMNNKLNAGKTGKGFYAALSLSIAMVGAAYWYAYSHNAKPVPRRTESSLVQTEPRQTLISGLTTVTQTQTTTSATQTQTQTEPAEEAAALFRKTTTSATVLTTTETAVTTARAELPAAPVDGQVLQPFSGGALVKSRTTGIWQTHNGTDYAAELGAEVVCVLDGTVTEIKHDPLWGVCVNVLHEDGTVTRYCGLNEGLSVMAGEVLERGTVIGTVGDTAEAEGLIEPHLHFEVLHNGAYADPEEFLHSAE